MAIELKDVQLTIDGLPIIAPTILSFSNGFTAVIGPSGAGKTTLLKVILGILTPSNGSVVIDERPVTAVHTACAYMPQDSMLLPWLTVRKNISLYQRLNHVPIDHQRVDTLLQTAGLANYADFLPRQLSGGMKQRVAFMRTVMDPAKYMVLDEPFGALDSMTRSLLQDWLLQLPPALKRPTIMITHDIEEAIYLADRIVVLSARPAHVLADITVSATKRNRAWLATQEPLHNKLYTLLREQAYAE